MSSLEDKIKAAAIGEPYVGDGIDISYNDDEIESLKHPRTYYNDKEKFAILDNRIQDRN